MERILSQNEALSLSTNFKLSGFYRLPEIFLTFCRKVFVIPSEYSEAILDIFTKYSPDSSSADPIQLTIIVHALNKYLKFCKSNGNEEKLLLE